MITHSLIQDLNETFFKLSETEKKKLENSTILITGCAGFLGYYFMRFFEHHKKKLKLKRVIGLDNFLLGKPHWIQEMESDSFFVIKKFDIIKDSIANVEEAFDADYIIHMASIASPVFYRKYPIETLDANIWGLRSLLDYYVNKKIKGFLFYSSSEIYGDPAKEAIPTKEDYRGNVSCTGPRACYDEAKRFGETMCMLFSEKFNLPIGVARPFNNYGPGMKINDKRVPADFAQAILRNQDIEILSGGTPTRTFCYIADAIAGYLKILLHGKYDYFNIGIESPEITIKELAEIYVKHGKKYFNYTGKVVFNQSEEEAYLTDNPERRCPNIEKARKILNYHPSINVDEGVERFLKFLKENEEKEYLW